MHVSAAPIFIDNSSDPRIEAYRDIRERDLKGRGGRFVIEGEVVLRTALQLGRFAIESILIAENRTEPLADLVAKVPAGIPVYSASRSVLDDIAGFPMHRGILAMGLRGEGGTAERLLATAPENALFVGLSAIANHDNMGGIFRNAAAFGLDGVLIDGTSCDPLYRKAIRVSAGAVLMTPFAQGGDIGTLCDALLAAGFEVLATSPAGKERLADIEPVGRQAVLFGAEGPGLPEHVLRRLRTIRIDMRGGFDSLNVATTSGIVLHHLAR
ncbi:TrmH family RNA methyltransferase [Labrys portucalensis]|uniref:TrmH family RNA methyltransferase n=1 Tax=Labrys neptuniae TaxID=376174 RepID=A0ABV6ZFA9_9HYPH|nr:RNA methyltransferase [Labrys neptuniae]MDT3378678.1 RNA methyltransferase [Labrys neptuniae]